MSEKFINSNGLYTYDDDNYGIVFTSNQVGNLAYQATGDNVLANRQQVANLIGRDLSDFVYAKQTHSANLYQVKEADCGRGVNSFEDGIEDVDCLYTFSEKPVLCAFYADCTPIWITSEEDNLMAVIHAGWQGTVKAIVFKAIEHFKTLGIDASNLKVVIGPSISKRNFEVEADVIKLIDNLEMIDGSKCYTQDTDVKYHADVKLVNKLLAIAAGVKEENIYVSDICTYESDDLFSFRQNNQTGRMNACIFKK